MKHVFFILLSFYSCSNSMEDAEESRKDFFIKKANRLAKINHRMPLTVDDSLKHLAKVRDDHDWFVNTFKNYLYNEQLKCIEWRLYWRVQNAETLWYENVQKETEKLIHSIHEEIYKIQNLFATPVKEYKKIVN